MAHFTTASPINGDGKGELVAGVITLPTAAELLERATAWLPTLIERAAYAEELRRLPDETRDEFVANQFHLVAQPKAYGGLDLGLETAAELAMEVGRGCGSTAWMTGQWPGHQFMVGTFGKEAQDEYWGPSPDTLSSTASAIVTLNATPERGGLRITDTLVKFSSGCDHAQWILLLTPYGVCLVPRSDFEIVDDWFIMGMQGTGSKSIKITDARVPPHRITTIADFLNGTSAGADLYPETVLYRVPANLSLNLLILAPVVGMARGILDIFEERAQKRIDGHTGERAAERPITQLRFAQSSFEVDVAMTVVRQTFGALAQLGREGRPATVAERTLCRRDITQAARLVIGAAERLLTAGDASGMYASNRWQRYARDIKVAGLQIVLTEDEPALSYSRVRWGMEATSRHT